MKDKTIKNKTIKAFLSKDTEFEGYCLFMEQSDWTDISREK